MPALLWLSDEQQDRIREHFPDENIPEGRAGRKPIIARKVLEGVLWILNTGAAVAHASAVLSKLQNGALTLSAVVPRGGVARHIARPGQCAAG
jgi:hypothetical protein